MLRVTAACSSASASGPVTSNLRSGDRSMTTAPSRQAQDSSTAPGVSKLGGSHHPRARATVSVLVPRAVVLEACGQPVSPVLGDPPGQLGPARLERGLAGEL